MKRRFLSIILILTLIMTMIPPITASAAQTSTGGVDEAEWFFKWAEPQQRLLLH